jgi:hypothetical protein
VADGSVGATSALVSVVAPSEDGGVIGDAGAVRAAEASPEVPAAPAAVVAPVRLVESVEPETALTVEFDGAVTAVASTGAGVERPVTTSGLPVTLSVAGASEVDTVVEADGPDTVVSPEPSVVVAMLVGGAVEEDTALPVGDETCPLEAPAETDCVCAPEGLIEAGVWAGAA